MPKVIFVLSNARSGTFYLREWFRLNAAKCRAVHEPFFTWGNPSLFGPAIRVASHADLTALRRLMEQKARYIAQLPCEIYGETSHAFLKSAYLVAHEFFDDLQLVRLIRDPIQVAKSLMVREALVTRWHIPMRT